MKLCVMAGLTSAFIFASAPLAGAATSSFAGNLDVIFQDDGGRYTGTLLGAPFSGEIDDATGFGNISDGATPTDFTCCEFAGLLELTDNVEIETAETQDLINGIQDVVEVDIGDMFDLVDLEGDVRLPNGNRIEVGLSFVLLPSAFDDEDLGNYPFDPDDLLFTLFFILEEMPSEVEDQTIYDVVGLVDDIVLPFGDDPDDPDDPSAIIPLPASILALCGAVFALLAVGRRRG